MASNHELEIKDVEYLHYPDETLSATVYLPKGPGPFPAILELHGGAWCEFDRHRGKALCEGMARHGFVVVSIDFSQGRKGVYPKSVAEINYAIRWMKAHAAELKTRPDLIGIQGQSSGGHLAMLVAMRPHDPRYTALSLPAGSPQFDATVKCVSMTWPVVNPLGRYRMARAWGKQVPDPKRQNEIMRKHHDYWAGGEDAELAQKTMSEGSPLLMLERGEKVTLVPSIWLQTKDDPVHIYHDPDSGVPGTDMDKFIAAFRKAGGNLDVSMFEGSGSFTATDSKGDRATEAFRQIAEFFHRHIPVKDEKRLAS